MKNKCEVCQSKDFKTIEVQEMMFGMKNRFEYLICKHCNSLTLNEVPRNLDSYYPKNYYSFSENNRQGKLKNWVTYKKDLSSLGSKSMFGYIFSSLFGADSNLKAINYCSKDKATEILDIGSGGGELLKKLKKNGYKNLCGIDPYLENDILEDGIVLRKQTIVDLVQEEKKFDIIILSHVLEHLENPEENLKNVLSLMKKEGRLIIRVPISSSKVFEYFKNNWYQIDAPRHLFIPSLKGIFILSEKLNLKSDYFFFDSSSKQFIASINYSKGISLIDQSRFPLWKRFNLRRIYYSIKSRILNKNKKGDQATFVFQKIEIN